MHVSSGETQIETILTMAIVKKKKKADADEDVEKGNSSTLHGDMN
jgi:hypothetical protein